MKSNLLVVETVVLAVELDVVLIVVLDDVLAVVLVLMPTVEIDFKKIHLFLTYF